jgi:hypothetical protein
VTVLTPAGRSAEPPPVEWTAWAGRPIWSRAYGLSLLIHLLAILILGASTIAARHGVPWESEGRVTIALDSQADEPNYYADEEGEASESAPQAAVEIPVASQAAGGDVAELFDEPPPVDPSGALPRPSEIVGPANSDVLATGVRGMLSAAGGTGSSTLPKGGKARTTVFGIEGEGYRFIYVFDRSGSMGGSGRSALAAAKAELKASLAHLEDTHQFQIIFYNQEPTIFPLAGQKGRLVFGTPENKASAVEFVDRITADGATRHEDALLAALKLGGDVIFFLTDADQPELSPRQLARIEQRNAGRAAINTIEFGLGPQIDSDNFLVRLARQNGGQHVYFDVSRLAAAR